MSENNLNKTIENWESKIESLWDKTLDKQTIIVWSDSKGRYLKNECSKNTLDTESKIIWWSRGGAKIGEELESIKRDHSLDRYNKSNTIIFLWFGTCDLTRKVSTGCIELVSEDFSTVEKITARYQEAVSYLRRKGFLTVILETPYYSIQYCNLRKGYADLTNGQADEKLTSQIDHLNENVTKINTECGTQAPKFNIDFRCSRSKKGKTQYHSNLKILRDGIHPGQKLSKAWVKKIVYFAGLNSKNAREGSRGQRKEEEGKETRL